MRIAMLRHGIAEDDAASDFDRALTRQGWEQLDTVLDRLQRTGWSPDTILYSRYVRTAQTAALVAAHFPTVPCLPLDDLATGSVEGILMGCARYPDPILVGHEPTMGNLCARLLGAPTGSVRFERAGFALVEVDRLPATRPARLVAFLPPGW